MQIEYFLHYIILFDCLSPLLLIIIALVLSNPTSALSTAVMVRYILLVLLPNSSVSYIDDNM